MPTNKQYDDLYEADEYYNDQNDYEEDEYRPSTSGREDFRDFDEMDQ